jgi:hypothetical protein
MVRYARGAAALIAVLATMAIGAPTTALARPDANYRRAADYGLLLTGALVAFVSHETGHLLMDGIFRTNPSLVGVSLGPLPFFAIQPGEIESDRELYVITQAGFMVEGIYTEIILRRHPELFLHHRPFMEGMLAFHAVLDLSYAITGLVQRGPPQSDVHSMARASGIPSWGIGTMLLVPLAFDAVRYFCPRTRRWSAVVGFNARFPMVMTSVVF